MMKNEKFWATIAATLFIVLTANVALTKYFEKIEHQLVEKYCEANSKGAR